MKSWLIIACILTAQSAYAADCCGTCDCEPDYDDRRMAFITGAAAIKARELQEPLVNIHATTDEETAEEALEMRTQRRISDHYIATFAPNQPETDQLRKQADEEAQNFLEDDECGCHSCVIL